MNAATRANATLAYLVLVLLLGGASAAGYSANLLLQLLGAGLIGWSLWDSGDAAPLHTGLRRFFLALGVLCLVQFIPLPPALWQHLPGRQTVYQGFVTLGAPAPWLTLSLAPWHSLSSFLWWLPAAALFVSMRGARAPLTRHVIAAITAVACISVAIEAMQVGIGKGYFYTITNFGQGPGFFANSNHQGSFLLAAMALWGSWLIGEVRSRSGAGLTLKAGDAINWALLLLLVVGALVSGSLACLLLLFVVLALLALVAKPDFRLPLFAVLLVVLAVVAGFAAFLLFGPDANDLTAKGVTAGISRQEFLLTGSRIVQDFAPIGSGTGTFLELYRWYEDPAIVGTTFVNHAHDDLLELLIETGIFGLAAVLLFLGWFVPRAWALWAGARRNVVPLAASVVIGVELLHSLVDYPLRTAAMSSVMAIACVLLVRPADPPKSRRGSRGGVKGSSSAEPTREMIKI